MPGHLLTQDSAIICPHGATVETETVTPRVRVAGACVLRQDGVSTVAGCPFTPFGGSGPTGLQHTITGALPCLTVTWEPGTTRVRSEGSPLLLDTSQGSTSPQTGVAQVTGVQQRVTAE